MNAKVAIFFVLGFLPLVFSHGILLCPTARSGMANGNGIKNPRPITAAQLNDCDGTNAGPIQATYVAGSSIAVVWETTIYHTNAPGVRIAVSYNTGDTFSQNILAPFGVEIGPDGIHGINVTLPAGKTSNNAIIQWIWDSASDGGYYIGCSDVKIVAAGGTPNVPVCRRSSSTSSTGSENASSVLSFSALIALVLIALAL